MVSAAASGRLRAEAGTTMASVGDLPHDDGGTAGVFALLDALSIAIQGASADSAAERLDDLKRIQESLSTAGKQPQALQVAGFIGSDPLSNLAGEIPIAVPFLFLSTLVGVISITAPSFMLVAAISMDVGWAEAWQRSPRTTAAIVSWLVLGVIFIGLQAWLFLKGLKRRSSELVRSRSEDSTYAELVRSRIDDLRHALRVEKQNVYKELAKRPEVRRLILGDDSRALPIGVTRSRGGGDDLAFHVMDRGGSVGAVPSSVEIDGLTIPVVVEGGADAPKPI